MAVTQPIPPPIRRLLRTHVLVSISTVLGERAMSYAGDTLNQCGGLDLDLSKASVVAVSGDGPNVCGHLLLFVGSGGGFYFHVAGEVRGRPRYMTQDGYRRYLREAKKSELRRLPVTIPNPDSARLKLEELMSKSWTWLVLPNNCVSFVEEVIAAGGGTWASASNCPALATAPTIGQQVSEFLMRMENDIYRLYGAPRF